MKKNNRVALLLPYYEGRNHHLFLGVAYLSAVLRRSGYNTLILDEDAVVFIMEQQKYESPIESARQYIIEKLKNYRPLVIGVSVNTANYNNSLELLANIRHHFPRIQLVVGGPHISTSWKTFMANHSHLCDFAIIGEGELTLLEICNRISSNNSSRGIKGCVQSNSLNGYYQPRALIKNLDSLPYPDRNGFYEAFPAKLQYLIDENYRYVFYSHLPGFKGKKFTRIVGSRGCDFSCKFCSPATFWKDPITGRNRRRLRNPIKIVNEIEYLTEHGYEAFYFDDPTFPFLSKPDFYKCLLEEIKKRRLQIAWAAPTRSDELNTDILIDLFEAGFTYTYFGLESFRKSSLHEMGKKVDIQKSVALVHKCKEIGIHCDVAYQIGLPGENYNSIIDGIQWLAQHGLQKHSFFSIAAIWPETPWAKSLGIKSYDFEPMADKKRLESKGLFYFEPGIPEIERYYSNCSGNYHFIDKETAIKAKLYLMDAGFIKRFDNKKKEINSKHSAAGSI